MRCGGACLIVRMFACSLGVLTGLVVRAFIGWSRVFACACLLVPLNTRVLRLVVYQPTWLLVGLEVFLFVSCVLFRNYPFTSSAVLEPCAMKKSGEGTNQGTAEHASTIHHPDQDIC